MQERFNAGRHVLVTGDGAQPPAPQAAALKRREFLSYALAASGALFTVGSLVGVAAPDPTSDALLGKLLPAKVNPDTGAKGYAVSGGFAYPRIQAGTFGGKFALDQKASSFQLDDPPVLLADGKFYVVKVAPDSSIQPAPNEDGVVNAANLTAIYQVCTHLGCLVPYIVSEKRFICPCHGSTFERNSQYVRGPAPRNLDQFPVTVVNDTVIVNTGQRVAGHDHA